jgi:hypothetical protein
VSVQGIGHTQFHNYREGTISYKWRPGAWKEDRAIEIITGEEAVKALTVYVIPK